MTNLINQIDRWGTLVLIYLLPWQARLLFKQGVLAGAPSEPQTISLFAVEILIWIMLVIRFSVLVNEKDKIHRGRNYSLRSPKNIFIAFGALALLTIFSVIISVDKTATLFFAQRTIEGLIVLFLVMTAPSEREARLAFIVSAIVVSLMGVVQIVFQRVYPSTWLGIAAHFPETAGTSVVESGGMRFLRAYGTLPHPNIFGGMMVMAILAVRPLFRHVSVIAWAVYFVLGLGLFFSFSRLAWIALIFGLIAQWLYARRDLVFVKSVPAAFLAMFICTGLFWPLVHARTSAVGRLEQKSVSARMQSYTDALSLIKNNLLVGVGAGAFTFALHDQVDQKRGGYEIEPAHSVPLIVWAEIGLFGLLIYLWLIFLLTRLAWKSSRIGLAVTLVTLASLDHWSWTTYGGIMIFWAGWGLIVRPCCEEGVTHKAGAIIISKDDPNKILLLYRDGPNYCDWTIPKGHMEPGESREDTTRREIKEETGLDIKIIRPLPSRSYHTFNGSMAMAHYYLAHSLDDSKIRLEPGFPKNKLQWVDIKDAGNVLTFDNMKEYYKTILKDIEKR